LSEILKRNLLLNGKIGAVGFVIVRKNRIENRTSHEYRINKQNFEMIIENN
jgi:hypothetical protein